MDVEVAPARTRQDREAFVRLPWRIYRGDANWVPPLLSDERNFIDRSRNPFFEHGDVEHFLARASGELVGRIAAVRNDAHTRLHGDRVGFFGLFESIDRPDVARALFVAAGDWLGRQGLDTMRGPMSYSTNDTCGLLVDGFDGPPFIMMPYNPTYYPRLVERCGFQKAKDLLAYLLPTKKVDHRQVERIHRVLAQRRGGSETARVRNMDKRRWTEEVTIVRDVYNRAWEKNWGFVPFTEKEFDHLAAQMKHVVDPEFVGILEVDGAPAGFGLALPDMNLAVRKANGRLFPIGLLRILWAARSIHRVRVPILGILPEHRGKGYDVLIYEHIAKAAERKRIECGETSWILEDNLLMRRAMERFGAAVHRVYRVYDRSLAAPAG